MKNNKLDLLLLLPLLLIVGCLQPTASPQKKAQPAPVKKQVTPTPIQAKADQESTIVISAEASDGKNVVESLFRYLGATNTATLKEELKIVQPDMTITIPPGASICWNLTESGGIITFLKPFPIIAVKKWGMTFHPTLQRIVLMAPDKGTAEVLELGKTVKKNFVLQWEDEDDRPSAPKFIPRTPQEPLERKLPFERSDGQRDQPRSSSEVPGASPEKKTLVHGYTNSPEERSKLEKEIEKLNPPFDILWFSSGELPKRGKIHPCFVWPSKGSTEPKGDDSDWLLEGWNGPRFLIEEFDRTRKLSKVSTKQKTAATPRCRIGFGSSWVESRLGYTTVRHLVEDHGLSYLAVKPYEHDREALNRIHGWCHMRSVNL